MHYSAEHIVQLLLCVVGRSFGPSALMGSWYEPHLRRDSFQFHRKHARRCAPRHRGKWTMGRTIPAHLRRRARLQPSCHLKPWMPALRLLSKARKYKKAGIRATQPRGRTRFIHPPGLLCIWGDGKGSYLFLQEAGIPSSSKKGLDLQLHHYMAQMPALFFAPPLGHPVHQRCPLLKRPARLQSDPLRCHHAGGSRARVSLTYTKSVSFPYPLSSCSPLFISLIFTLIIL